MTRDVDQEILDATCGGRSIWTDGNKDRDDTLYIDKREEPPGFAEDGRKYSIEPDEVQDFRDLPYPDDTFTLVVWDPPHVLRQDGMEQLSGIIPKKYGALHAETWQDDLAKGFQELWRVLAPGGTLVFKYADRGPTHEKVLDVFPVSPLFGTNTKQGRVDTRWYVFHKPEQGDGQ